METIAVYWEERIKVYGITGKPGLAMGVLRFPAIRTACWGDRIIELEGALKRFELVTCHGTENDGMELHLLVEGSGRDTMLRLVNQWLTQETQADFSLSAPVDMVFLHGPHFQDRFGIADAAFSALAKNALRIVHSGCAGTSMYLILPENQGATAMRILADTFLIPASA